MRRRHGIIKLNSCDVRILKNTQGYEEFFLNFFLVSNSLHGAKKNMGTKIILKCEREVFSGQADSVVWRWILLQKGIEIESSRP